MRTQRIFIILFSILFIATFVFVYGTNIPQRMFIFYPDRRDPSLNGIDTVPNKKDIIFGNGLRGWLIQNVEGDFLDRKVLLFSHGNAGNISHRGKILTYLSSEIKADIFIYDYSGFGLSKGEPSEKQVYKDAESAYDYLIEIGYQSNNIFPFGESLGGAASIDLSLKRKMGGVILLSTFSCLQDLVPSFLSPFCFFFRSCSKAPKVNVPVFIIHSKEDEIVPFKSAITLYESWNAGKKFYEITGRHNDPKFDKNFPMELNNFINDPRKYSIISE